MYFYFYIFINVFIYLLVLLVKCNVFIPEYFHYPICSQCTLSLPSENRKVF